MQIEEAKKILKGMFYNDNGEKMHYIDFSDSYGDEWGGYTLPEYIEAIETVLNELEKKDNKIKELEGRCRNLDKEAQSYFEELMGDSTLKNRTIKQLNSELEKKDKVILEAINYMEKTFEMEDEKCITELYDILKKASEE